MDIATIIGLAAGALTTSSFIPQVAKIWRIKETKDISLWMYIIIVAGLALWLAYGIMRSDLPVMIANSLALILTSAVLVLKIRYR